MTIELESPVSILSEKQAAALKRRLAAITKETESLNLLLETKGTKKCRLKIL